MIHRKKNQEGFLVLLSVIILSVVLLLIAQQLSTSGYFQGEGALDFEQKELSYFTAFSCIDRAWYKMTQDLDYAGGETLQIGDQSCTISALAASGTDTIIRASATAGGSTTKLKMVVNQYLAFVSFTEE